jgi:hypothetical protein
MGKNEEVTNDRKMKRTVGWTVEWGLKTIQENRKYT